MKRRRLKRTTLLGSLIIILMVSMFSVIPWVQAQEYWEVELPSQDTVYDETLVTYENDANAEVSIAANLHEIDVDCPIAPQSQFAIPIVAAANSRRNMGYSTHIFSPDYIEIWDHDTLSLGDDDGAWVPITIHWMGHEPFDFLYYGHWYWEVFITSNGFVTFDKRAYPDNGALWTSPNPVSIPTVDSLNTIVAPFWRDLDPSKGGTIRYGDGPYDSFVVMWDNVYNKANSNRQTFAVYFYPEWTYDDEFIVFVYGSITNDVPTSIGIEDQTGGRGHSISSARSSGQRVEFIPWPDNYHRITEIEVSASKLTAGGANDGTARIYIEGWTESRPGGTNVILEDPSEGKYDVPKIVSVGAFVLGGAGLALGYGWLGVAGFLVDGAILAYELSPMPRGTTVYEAMESTKTGYVESAARDEKHFGTLYDRAFDVDLHPLILWRLVDPSVTHRLVITAKITVQRPDTSTYTLTTPSIELKVTPRTGPLPPATPSTPSGPSFGYPGYSYSYSTSTTDPNGDNVRYQFDWGDGTTTTTGYYASGVTVYSSHSWSSTGYKYVRVKAQDTTGLWSPWSSSLAVYINTDSCVAEGTLVTMADGTVKPIEDIKKGNQVLGFWPTNGSYMAENVLDTIKHQVEVLVNINNGTLKLTPLDQPIYIRNSTYEGWMRDPANIQVGWEIYNTTSNGWVPVTSVTFEEGKTRAYDLVLDGYTTYIANGILVMDKNGSC